MTATPDKYPQGRFKDKACRRCGTIFSPVAPSHLYCSQECADDAYSERYLKKAYGISLDEYRKMREAHNDRCDICGSEGFTIATGKQRAVTLKLAVDHDHITGEIRGLLCHNCNRALGLMQDDVAALRKAADYLEGATTIPKGSSGEAPTKRTAPHVGDDMVCSA